MKYLKAQFHFYMVLQPTGVHLLAVVIILKSEH